MKEREKGFELYQHINEQQIPKYDAIMDEANKFVENTTFQQAVSVTRPLTPEHAHVLENRIKMKDTSDRVIMGLTGVRPPRASMRSRPGTSSGGLSGPLSGLTTKSHPKI